MMTKEQIEKKIAEIKNAMFMLDMADCWESDDYAWYDEQARELARLNKALEAMA